MYNKSVKSLLAAAAVSCGMVGAVSATPVSLEYVGPASGYSTLVIKESPVNLATGQSTGSVLAGAFEMRDTTANSALGTFLAYCLDISHWLGTTGTHSYETTATPFSSSYGLSPEALARVQAFFDANYFVGLEVNEKRSAAFQMGLWEVLYDDDFSLVINTSATNDFRGAASGEQSSIDAVRKAGKYLAAAEAYMGGGKQWDLTFLESQGGKQNLVTVSAVPLPATALLLFGGLAGLGAAARRRRKA